MQLFETAGDCFSISAFGSRITQIVCEGNAKVSHEAQHFGGMFARSNSVGHL